MSRLFTGAFSSFKALSSKPAVIGSVIGLGLTTHALRHSSIIRLDSYDHPVTAERRAVPYERKVKRTGRLNGKIDYQQMTLGSFAGLLCGFVIGKMSKVLVWVAAGGILALQYLQSRGIIARDSALPLLGDAVHFLRRRVNVSELATEKPSFKLSFTASFVVAALYA